MQFWQRKVYRMVSPMQRSRGKRNLIRQFDLFKLNGFQDCPNGQDEVNCPGCMIPSFFELKYGLMLCLP